LTCIRLQFTIGKELHQEVWWTRRGLKSKLFRIRSRKKSSIRTGKTRGKPIWQGFNGISYPFFYSSEIENRFAKAAVELVQQVFVILLVTYLLLLLGDTIWEESVSGVLNLNYLLIAVVVIGIPAVLISRKKPAGEVRKPVGGKDILMVSCAAIAGAVIVWYKTRDIGWPSIIMSIISCILIALLSLLILKDGDEE
jgi:hypothetical protein